MDDQGGMDEIDPRLASAHIVELGERLIQALSDVLDYYSMEYDIPTTVVVGVLDMLKHQIMADSLLPPEDGDPVL